MRKVANRTRKRTGTTVGIFCFVAGLLAPLMGGLLATVEWIVETSLHPWLHIASTTLFVIGIPLILFAGFCLDWAESPPKRATQARPALARRNIPIKSS